MKKKIIDQEISHNNIFGFARATVIQGLYADLVQETHEDYAQIYNILSRAGLPVPTFSGIYSVQKYLWLIISNVGQNCMYIAHYRSGGSVPIGWNDMYDYGSSLFQSFEVPANGSEQLVLDKKVEEKAEEKACFIFRLKFDILQHG